MIGPTGHRSCLARAQGRAAPTDEDLLAMRRAAWRSQGVIVLRPEDVARRLGPPGAGQRGQPAVRPAAGERAVSARPGHASARVKPHKVRGRELEEVRERDPEGRIVVHHRTVDSLGKMLRAGTID